MALAGLGTVIFILTFVLPKMSSLFQNFGDQLPLPTIIMLKLSGVLRQSGLWPFVALLFAALLIYRWLKSSKGRKAIGRVVVKLPVFGEILLKTELARFCRTMILLMQSGVSIVRALRVVIPLMSNEMVRDKLTLCENELTEGGSFGDGLKKAKEIPIMMGHMIAIGEESGNLEAVLHDIAENYEQETDEQIKIMTTLLEPLMILIVGSIVGFMVFAMLLPIFQTSILTF